MICIDPRYGDCCYLSEWPDEYGIPNEGQQVTIDRERWMPYRWVVTEVSVNTIPQDDEYWLSVDVRPDSWLIAIKWWFKHRVYSVGRKLCDPHGLWWRNRWLEPYASDPNEDPNELRNMGEVIAAHESR